MEDNSPKKAMKGACNSGKHIPDGVFKLFPSHNEQTPKILQWLLDIRAPKAAPILRATS